MRKLTIIAAMLLLLPAVSQAKGLEELLVEKGVITKGEARASMHEGGSKVYWNKGTRLEFAETGFTTKINTDIQTRYEYTDREDDDNTSSFDINRARFTVSGSALHEEFNYKLQVDFKNGTADTKDVYLQWNICDWGNIRMGQHKSTFSRQNLNSGTKLQFVDRSFVSDFFSVDRGRGATLAAGLNDDWEFAASIFNGLSDGEGINKDGQDTKHMGVFGIRGDLMGDMNAHEEGDVGHTEDWAVNIGSSVVFSENEGAAFAGGSADMFGVSADVNAKYKGFSFHGEFYYMEHDPDAADSFEATGFYAQAGYFLEPKEWEIAARYGFIDCDDGMGFGADVGGGLDGSTNNCIGQDDINTADASINYYWWKHHLKAQLGYQLVTTDAVDDTIADNDTNRWIFQLSSWF